jgi:hypothetical protein
MRHIAVKSSNVASIAYDEPSHNMQVKFKNGSTYQYPNVPPEVHAKFLNASSPGSHFAAHIKPYFTGKKVS